MKNTDLIFEANIDQMPCRGYQCSWFPDPVYAQGVPSTDRYSSVTSYQLHVLTH